MANFKLAIDTILKHEGGYVNDPTDPGGETKYGICKKQYPELDIKNLTIDQASEIYKRDYWDRVNGDLFASDDLALNVFDFAVNAGVGTSAKLIQGIVGVKQDGSIGPVTIKVINSKNASVIIREFQKERILHYVDLCKRNTSLLKYLKGWISRAFL